MSRTRKQTSPHEGKDVQDQLNKHYEQDDIHEAEYLLICNRRIRAWIENATDGDKSETHHPNAEKTLDENVTSRDGSAGRTSEKHLIGLALSGGGIRSATFGLGVVQGLAHLNLLKTIDYLSTVSGGGYIGSWLETWIKREGDLENVRLQLEPQRVHQAKANRGFRSKKPSADTFIEPGRVQSDEPHPIAHLREYSNYLSPRVKMLSIDSWTLIAIYVRNLLANLLSIVPLFLIAILFVRLYAASPHAFGLDLSYLGNAAGTIGLVAISVSFLMVAKSLYVLSRMNERGESNEKQPEKKPIATDPPADAIFQWPLGSGRKWLWIIVALVGSSALFLNWALQPRQQASPGENVQTPFRLGLFEHAVDKVERHLPKLSMKDLTTGKVKESFEEIKESTKVTIQDFTTFNLKDMLLFVAIFAGLRGISNRARFWERRLFLFDCIVLLVYGLLWWRYDLAGDFGSLFDRILGDNGDYSKWVSEHGLIFLPLLGTLFGLCITTIMVILILLFRPRKANSPPGKCWMELNRATILPTLFGIVSGAVGGAVMYVVLNQLIWNTEVSVGIVTTFGPALLLVALSVAGIVEVALLGNAATEQEREWWARLLAMYLLMSFAWVTICGLSLYGPLWLQQLGLAVQLPLIGGWIGTTLITLLTANNKSQGKFQAPSRWSRIQSLGPYLFLIGLVCMLAWTTDWLLIVGDDAVNKLRIRAAEKVKAYEVPNSDQADTQVVLDREPKDQSSSPDGETIVSQHASYILRADSSGRVAASHWASVRNPVKWRWLTILAVCLIIAISISLRVDVNEFSLNALYANRLSACFLGASRRYESANGGRRTIGATAHCHGRERVPHPVTGFDHFDDIALTDLQIGKANVNVDHTGSNANGRSKAPIKRIEAIPYFGPYPLINTALNLVGGDQLAWQERMAESFVLSPLFCGCKSLGYRRSEKYADCLTLGRAVAISGAAASPNMGSHSSTAVTALMTFFNVRLGWWLPNPGLSSKKPAVKTRKRTKPGWQTSGPSFLLRYLAAELFSMTNSKSKFLNISDGGHFENLGVYELVRRRCRCIIVSDAGADPSFEFEDLSGLIRKCRIDFGVDIEIDTSPLHPDPQTGRNPAHCVIGTIRYDMVDPSAPVGLLLYIKPSLTGDETEDVLQYKVRHNAFPHEPTKDQFFSESQFESYRALGYHCVREALEGVSRHLPLDSVAADRPAGKKPIAVATAKQINLIENLVWRLKKQWMPLPNNFDEGFRRSTTTYINFQRDLRNSGASEKLASMVYPELGLGEEPPDAAQEHSEAEPQAQQIALDLQVELEGEKPSAAGQEHFEAGLQVQQTALELQDELKGEKPPAAAQEHSEAEPQALETALQNHCEKTSKLSPETEHMVKRAEIDGESLRLAVQMFQIMEDTWLDVGLSHNAAHPLVSGWMNVFHRWSRMPLLQTLWPLLRNEYSTEFVSFCENLLPLSRGKIEIVPVKLAGVKEQNSAVKNEPQEGVELATVEEQKALFRELIEEWPSCFSVDAASNETEFPNLADWIFSLGLKGTAVKPLNAWVIRAGRISSHKKSNMGMGLPAGIVALGQVEASVAEEVNNAIKADKQSRVLQFFVWIRPAFRYRGIGTYAVQHFLSREEDDDNYVKIISADGNKSVPLDEQILLLYHPTTRWRGAQTDFDKAGWLSFFSFYGFRLPSTPPKPNDEHLCLIRDGRS